MARLPVPGQDHGQWGNVLNEFLSVAHEGDGRLKPFAIDSAGAVMITNPSAANMQFVISEPDMVSNSATKIPTQQSVKAYVDAAVSNIDGGSGVATGIALVAASNASAEVKAAATYVCDGTADNVEIQSALDAYKMVWLSEGTFNIGAPLVVRGTDDYETPTQHLQGRGKNATRLVGAAGVNIIELVDSPMPTICDMTLDVNGSGDGIVSTGSTALLRGFWQAHFSNLFIKTSFTPHTGWGMNLGNPFRSVFENIEMFNVANGIRLHAQHSYNPGDCTFNRVFIELNNSPNGVGIHLYSPPAWGL